MRNLRRNAALTGAAALAAFGIGGAVTAHASTNDPAPIVQQSDGDGEVDDAAESEGPEGAEGAEEASDGPDQGPDANPDEPGHQDADESGETE
jgi:hypothetical protein